MLLSEFKIALHSLISNAADLPHDELLKVAQAEIDQMKEQAQGKAQAGAGVTFSGAKEEPEAPAQHDTHTRGGGKHG